MLKMVAVYFVLRQDSYGIYGSFQNEVENLEMAGKTIIESLKAWVEGCVNWFFVWVFVGVVAAGVGGLWGMESKNMEAKELRKSETDFITGYHAPYPYITDSEERQDIRRALKDSRTSMDSFRRETFVLLVGFGCVTASLDVSR